MMMLPKIRFLPLLMLVAGLCSCSLGVPKIGLLVYNENDPFMEEFSAQIQEAAAGAFSVKVYYAGNSQLIQNEQIEKAIADRPAVIMINPVDRLGAFAIIRRLKAENIPVIFFNREPLASDLALWDKTWYVGARPEQSGQLEAKLAMDLFGGDPKNLNRYDRNRDGRIQMIILKGEQGHQDAEIRTSEVLKSFRKQGFDIEVLALEVANWNRDEAYSKTGRLLERFPGQIELVLSNNDAMALGAISRMRQADLFKDTNGNGKIDQRDTGWIPVIGIDGLAEAEESIAEGYLYATVKNDSLTMARSMVTLAIVLTGKSDPSFLPAPVVNGKYVWINYFPFLSEH